MQVQAYRQRVHGLSISLRRLCLFSNMTNEHAADHPASPNKFPHHKDSIALRGLYRAQETLPSY